MTSKQATLAVVLCAGGSRRMGSPKALLQLGGRALVARHVEALRAHAVQVAVVLGAAGPRVAEHLSPEVEVTFNPAWATSWPIDSLRCALQARSGVQSCLVTPVDTLPALPETLAALLEAGPPCVPISPDGEPGHPVLLGAAELTAVRGRSVPGGLRTLLAGAPTVAVADPFVGRDFDDPTAWDELSRAWRAARPRRD